MQKRGRIEEKGKRRRERKEEKKNKKYTYQAPMGTYLFRKPAKKENKDN